MRLKRSSTDLSSRVEALESQTKEVWIISNEPRENFRELGEELSIHGPTSLVPGVFEQWIQLPDSQSFFFFNDRSLGDTRVGFRALRTLPIDDATVEQVRAYVVDWMERADQDPNAVTFMMVVPSERKI